ncbi:MAG TPA: hypothetical protein DCF63_03220 [Planctomycetaceae bacterium]|nr:hypothetical protein [Planctomycetaceae bacterium]
MNTRISIPIRSWLLWLPILWVVVRLNSTSVAFDATASTPGSDLQWYQPSFWRTVDGKPVEESWQFTEDEIHLIQPRGGSGSLISPPLPENFEVSFQWKIEPGGNNGLKYRAGWFEDRWLGIEYQLIDEPIPLPEPKIGSTASIYDLFAPSLDKPLHPAGQWNHAKIVAQGHRIEHYLNHVLVASADTASLQWQLAIAKSKFFGVKDFGQPRSGDSIILTDRGGLAAYRDFQLKLLPPLEQVSPTVARVPQLYNAFRNGWADQTSIVIWTRTTAASEMLTGGYEFLNIPAAQAKTLGQSRDSAMLNQVQLPSGAALNQINGACPGAEGEVRLTYFPEEFRTLIQSTAWSRTDAQQDYTHQWKLEGLLPGARYIAIVESRPMGSDQPTAFVRGGLQTASPTRTQSPVTFCVTTCHDYIRRDDGDSGHKIYPSMSQLRHDFVVHAGDVEYYDKPLPWAWTVELMRFKWARLFSLPSNRNFYSNHTTYWIKDDHDTLKNDCWAGQHYGAVSFEEGAAIFNQEQFPSFQPRYRTIQWGKDLQFWVLEGRDFRSPNTMPDGPTKTILGNEQKEWLKRTLAESTATFKLVFSPTPIVGPDRLSKSDNHSNEVFEFEGNELRQLFGATEGLLVFCGDRHWQYASLDTDLNLWEFGCGPGSQNHELGWKQNDIRLEHRFLRVQGGFLSGTLNYDDNGNPKLVIGHHDVQGRQLSNFPFLPDDNNSHDDSE